MDIHAQDEDFQDIGLIENYETLIWSERYSAFGDFDLKLPKNHEYRDLLATSSYLTIPSSKYTMCLETTEEDNSGVKVKGRSLESILDRRIIEDAGPTAATSHTNYIVKLIGYNIGGSAVVPERRVSTLFINDAVPPGFVDTTTYEPIKYGENLYATVRKLANERQLGFRILNPEASVLMSFEFYFGEDHSAFHGEPVIFSESLGNIQNVKQLKSSAPYKNLAVVNLPPWDGSVGLGEIWRIQREATAPSGLARREVWSDATDLRKDETFDATNKPARAAAWGRQAVIGYPNINNTDFEIVPQVPGQERIYKYDVDYKLGDLVAVAGPTGAFVTHRVTEYIQSFGPEGDSEYPTLTVE
jgi:hypothetical protein